MKLYALVFMFAAVALGKYPTSITRHRRVSMPRCWKTPPGTRGRNRTRS